MKKNNLVLLVYVLLLGLFSFYGCKRNNIPKPVDPMPNDKTYTITWKNYDGSVLKTEQLNLNKTPKYEGTPQKPDTQVFTYKFIGWDKEIEKVKSDATYIAKYKELKRLYTITWKTTNDHILKTEKLEYGVMPKYNGIVDHNLEETEDYYYEFIGWDKELSEVKLDTTYMAQFEKKLTALGRDKEKELEKIFDFSLIGLDAYYIKGKKDYPYKDLVLPSEYKGKPISKIENDAFYGCKSLISVTIPNSVTSIGDNAFFNCNSLSSVTIPNSVTSIGKGAFSDCALSSITIPNSVTSIGNSAFSLCKSLSSVTISNSATSIGTFAFYGCKVLSSITIPNSVTSIGEEAFSDCALSSITIPNSVTSIGDNPFVSPSLKEIKVDSANPNYDSRENCNAIIEKSSNTLISGCSSTVIPNSVTSIGNSAFHSCKSLSSITIPNSVSSIGESAFNFCKSLSSITIPNSVTSIGNFAFYGCMSLSSITIPNSVISIGENAFHGCALSSITIPNSVTSIGTNPFNGCSSLKEIKVDSANPNYDSRENCNAIIEKSSNTLISGCSSTVIPNSVVSIGNFAFSGCKSLSSITIPNSVTSIGEGAFNFCVSLSSIIIPNSVTSIAYQSFVLGTKIYFEAEEKPSKWNEYSLPSIHYWYSETPNKDGKHWHYVDGKPTVWE